MSWWQHYRSEQDELFVLTVRDEHRRLIGIAPWYLHRSKLSGRSIRFLGSGTTYSEYLTILTATADSQSVISVLVDYLIANDHQWDTIILERLDTKDEVAASFARQFVSQRYRTAYYRCESCWRIALPATWPDYLATLKSSRRRQIRQLERRYIASNALTWQQATAPAQIDQGLSFLAELNRRRLSSLGRQSSFEAVEFERFLRTVTHRFDESGQLRLRWVFLSGQIAAARLDFAGGQVIYSYQSGIEPALLTHRPGWLDMILTLQQAVEEGYRSFDLLGGDDPYKARWGALERLKYSLFIASNSVAGHYQRHLRNSAFMLNKLYRLGGSGRGSLVERAINR